MTPQRTHQWIAPSSQQTTKRNWRDYAMQSQICTSPKTGNCHRWEGGKPGLPADGSCSHTKTASGRFKPPRKPEPLGSGESSQQPPRQAWGKTVLWRVYCELRLNLPRRGKKRLPARIKRPLQAAAQPNQGWSCDFMSDALWSGRRFRTFNVSAHRGRHQPACCERTGGGTRCAAVDSPGQRAGVHRRCTARASLCSTSNLENRPRTPVSNDSTRPSAPRCWTAACSSRCRKCAT